MNRFLRIPRPVLLLLTAQLLLNLVNAGVVLILNIHLKNDRGLDDATIARLTSYHYLAVLTLAVPAGLYLRGRRVRPFFLFGSIVLPLATLWMLDAISRGVMAEMSAAIPKRQAKEPIDLDIILVCRKRKKRSLRLVESDEAEEASADANRQISRLNEVSRKLSRNDVRVVLLAQLIKRLSWRARSADSLAALDSRSAWIDQQIEALVGKQCDYFEGRT